MTGLQDKAFSRCCNESDCYPCPGTPVTHVSGLNTPVELDSFQLLKKITMRGYSADDDPDARIEWDAHFAKWLRAGSIAFPHVVVKGIEQAPEAIQAVAEGKYFGTVVVEL